MFQLLRYSLTSSDSSTEEIIILSTFCLTSSYVIAGQAKENNMLLVSTDKTFEKIGDINKIILE